MLLNCIIIDILYFLLCFLSETNWQKSLEKRKNNFCMILWSLVYNYVKSIKMFCESHFALTFNFLNSIFLHFETMQNFELNYLKFYSYNWVEDCQPARFVSKFFKLLRFLKSTNVILCYSGVCK